MHDENTFRIISDPEHWAAWMREQVQLARATFPEIDNGFEVFTTNRLSHNQIVFHHSLHVREKWSQFMPVLNMFSAAHDYATAVVLSKD